MELFNFNADAETKAIQKIEKINSEVKKIRNILTFNDGVLNHSNSNEVRPHFNNIMRYLQEYERIKQNMSNMERTLFMGATVDVWNGERVGVLKWEFYLQGVLQGMGTYM